MKPPDLPQPPQPAVLEPILRTLVLAGGLLVAGDFLMWSHEPRLGFAIFAMLMGIVLLVQGSRTKRAWVAFVLLAASCVQAAISLCLTNVCMMLLLFAVLLGESRYSTLPAGCARWLEGFLAWLKGLGRWIWLIEQLFDSARWQKDRAGAWGAKLGRLLRIGAPAVILFAIFGIVLSQGNALLAHEFNLGFQTFGDWLSRLQFSPGRIFFWLLLVTIALVATRPADPPSQPRSVAKAPGTWVRTDASVAFWQSILILASLNLLFLAVNAFDIAYLWMHGRPPEGVNEHDYVHSGTNSLITATVLSAVVLAAVFQQQSEISRRRLVRLLAHLWIVQNLTLLTSVGLRLKLYYDVSLLLTDTRIHLALFLALVAVGFGFLVFHIELGPDLRLLLWRNTCAAFVLLYTIQFINTVGIAAKWNVTRWATIPNRGFDLDYLKRQGSDAWPALLLLARSTNTNGEKFPSAADALHESAKEARKQLDKENWRERQIRYTTYARELIAAEEKKL